MARVPHQWKILTDLQTWLEGITPAAGFDNDMTNRVFIGRLSFGQDEKPPFLSIVEAPPAEDAAAADLHRTHLRYSWRLWVQGWAEKDSLEGLYVLKAETEKRLAALAGYEPTAYLGRSVAGMKMVPASVRPANPQSGVGPFFYLQLELDLAYRLSDPFVTV